MVDKNLHYMVTEYLKVNKYDGLFRPDFCACKVDELMPCDEPQIDCEAGYLTKCSEDEFCPNDGDDDCDFHIGAK